MSVLKKRGDLMKEYKVMLFIIKIEGDYIQRFEVSLNQMAAEGWVLNSSNFRGKDHFLVIMEKDK